MARGPVRYGLGELGGGMGCDRKVVGTPRWRVGTGTLRLATPYSPMQCKKRLACHAARGAGCHVVVHTWCTMLVWEALA